MWKILVSGAAGRMGKRIINLARQDRELEIVAGLERRGHPQIGEEIEGVILSEDINLIEKCDCLIEFSTPQAVIEHLPFLVKFKKKAVIGTTGLNDEEQRKIREASQQIAVVFSPNMSVGVNVLFRLIEEAAKVLQQYKIHIQEAHHIHKKDAPSGTAKKIASLLNTYGFNLKIEDIEAIREDEIVGDHRIVFDSEVDKLEIFHSAKTRDIFAKGALVAAKWLKSKEKGLYSMKEVLFGKNEKD